MDEMQFLTSLYLLVALPASVIRWAIGRFLLRMQSIQLWGFVGCPILYLFVCLTVVMSIGYSAAPLFFDENGNSRDFAGMSVKHLTLLATFLAFTAFDVWLARMPAKQDPELVASGGVRLVAVRQAIAWPIIAAVNLALPMTVLIGFIAITPDVLQS